MKDEAHTDLWAIEDLEEVRPEAGPFVELSRCGDHLRPRNYTEEGVSNLYYEDLEANPKHATMLRFLGAQQKAQPDFFGRFLFVESEDPEDAWSEKRLHLALAADGTCDYFSQEIVNRESPPGNHWVGVWRLVDTCIECIVFGLDGSYISTGQAVDPPHLEFLYFTKASPDALWLGHPSSQGKEPPIVRVGYSSMECPGVLKRIG